MRSFTMDSISAWSDLRDENIKKVQLSDGERVTGPTHRHAIFIYIYIYTEPYNVTILYLLV